jgi:hypothetical protein
MIHTIDICPFCSSKLAILDSYTAYEDDAVTRLVKRCESCPCEMNVFPLNKSAYIFFEEQPFSFHLRLSINSNTIRVRKGSLNDHYEVQSDFSPQDFATFVQDYLALQLFR